MADEWRPSKQPEYREESWRLEETCCLSNCSDRPSANADVKISNGANNNNKMYKISNEVINFIEKTMKNWRVEMTAGGKSFAEVKIQRGMFWGDALSPLLFVVAMVPLNHILWKCTASLRFTIAGKDQSPNLHGQYQTIRKK